MERKWIDIAGAFVIETSNRIWCWKHKASTFVKNCQAEVTCRPLRSFPGSFMYLKIPGNRCYFCNHGQGNETHIPTVFEAFRWSLMVHSAEHLVCHITLWPVMKVMPKDLTWDTLLTEIVEVAVSEMLTISEYQIFLLLYTAKSILWCFNTITGAVNCLSLLRSLAFGQSIPGYPNKHGPFSFFLFPWRCSLTPQNVQYYSTQI